MSPAVQLLVGFAVAGASIVWMGAWLVRFFSPFWEYPGVRQAHLGATHEEPAFGQTNAVAIQVKVGLAAVGLGWGAIQVMQAMGSL